MVAVRQFYIVECNNKLTKSDNEEQVKNSQLEICQFRQMKKSVFNIYLASNIML